MFTNKSNHFKAITAEKTDATEPLSKKVIRGGVWVFTLRIINRGLGFIRTIILARLLAPEDFGLFGIAMLSISMLETFSQTGFQAALIQKKDDVESYLNTAWTVSVVRGIILFLILFLSAPFIAGFFKSPQSAFIIRIIAIYPLLSGFGNIGILFYQKDLKFHKQFVYEFSTTVIDLAVAVTLAFILKSVWALIWSGLAAHCARLLLSYSIHPFRPSMQFKTDKFKDISRFGKWVFFSSIIIFCLTQGDDIFVGKMLGISALGLYQMAYMLSNLPATEITHIISQVTFPAYSKIQDDVNKLGTAYLKVFQLTSLLAFLFAGSIFILSPQFTQLFLGDIWMPMVPALQVLCLFGLTRSIGATMGPILYSVGKPIIQTKLSSIQLLLMVIIIYPFSISWGIIGVSWAVVIPNVFALTLIIRQIRIILDLRYKDILDNLAIPCIAGIMMCFIMLLVNNVLSRLDNLVGFFISFFLCIVLYLGIVYLLDIRKSYIWKNIHEIFIHVGSEK